MGSSLPQRNLLSNPTSDTKDVRLKGNHVDYMSKHGKAFALDFVSDVGFESRFLCGSEDPKGGWISYGYPVREPIGQVTMAYNGKAPFVSATIIKPKGIDASVRLEGKDVILKIAGDTWTISREGVKRT